LKAADFVDEYSPVRVGNGPTIWIHGTEARWVIANPDQRLRLDAIAKDCQTMDELVFPVCDTLKVLDQVVNAVYSISVEDFRRYATARNYGYQQQYFCWRRYWVRTPLEALVASAPDMVEDGPVQPRLFDGN
jgi:hypothetical protein